MNLSVNPILPLGERNPERGPFQEKVLVDSKVSGVVLEKISQAKSALLPSASAPQVVINLLPAFESTKFLPQFKRKKKRKIRKTPLPRSAPIGLLPVDPEGCINAIMQFVLSIQGLAENFYFAPRSFHVFQEFIDQYHADQQEKHSVSTADGGSVFRFLSMRIEELSLHEIFQFLLQSLHLNWGIYPSLNEALKTGRPSNVFVKEKSTQKQFITQPDCVCYELDAFIELRSDGTNVNFVTFVKLEGSWYQCDDERITQLRSYHLSGSLQRSVLLHYKRLSLNFKR